MHNDITRQQDKPVISELHMPRPIKKLVFNGGGARGVGMPGVYYALTTTFSATDKKATIWDGIETIAGTSVGSITGALFCVGPDNDDLQTEIFNQNLLNILGIGQHIIKVNMSLVPLKNFLNNYLKKHFEKYLLSENRELTNELVELKSNLKDTNYLVTFADLNSMRQCCPDKFKNLVVTSTTANNSNMDLVLYDYKKTPEFSIAEACMASSALPFIFQPVIFNGRRQLDGGCGEPLPSECFPDEDSNETDRHQERLLFVFGPGPSFLGRIWQKTLFGPPEPELFFDIASENAPASGIKIDIDNDNKLINYTVYPKNISGSVNFSLLNIPENMVLTKDNFQPFKAVFYTELNRKSQIPSILGDYAPIWLLDRLGMCIQFFLGFPLYIATLFESLCQRLRSLYAFNTVILHTTLTGNAFEEGEKTKRTVAATYYLDTINYLVLYGHAYEAHESFYISIVDEYTSIYKILMNTLKAPKDRHLSDYNNFYANFLNNSNYTYRKMYEIIKDDVENDPYSWRAFALTCAVELHLGHKTRANIAQEIAQRAQQKSCAWGSFFARKNNAPLDTESTTSGHTPSPDVVRMRSLDGHLLNAT